jgi:hypothetical protein
MRVQSVPRSEELRDRIQHSFLHPIPLSNRVTEKAIHPILIERGALCMESHVMLAHGKTHLLSLTETEF